MNELSIGEFFRQCVARGRMPLRDHLNSTAFPDELSAKYMRARAMAAMKTTKYAHMLNIVQNDGSRSSVFNNRPVVTSNVPAPIRPSSVSLVPLIDVVTANDFNLPNVQHDLTATEHALKMLSRKQQIAAVKGIVALNSDRVIDRNAIQAAQMRANDLAEQLAETRRDKAFLQQTLMRVEGGKNITK
jgi:hypothetical protein